MKKNAKKVDDTAAKVAAKVTEPANVASVQVEPAAKLETATTFVPSEFETIVADSAKEISDLHKGVTYLSKHGHYLTIVDVWGAANGLAHGHYHVTIDGNEIPATNPKAVFNGCVTFWSPELKKYLAGETTELKQQSVKYANATTGGRSLYDLSSVLPSNYIERGEKSYTAAIEKVASALKAVETLNKAVSIPFAADLAGFATKLADHKQTYLAGLAKLAKRNETEKAAKVAEKVATAVSELSIDAQLAALQAQIAKLQAAQSAATATA